MTQIKPLLEIMARLRDPQTGCPWDIEQNFATIAPYTIEEAYEVAEAISKGDMGELKGELGDLLLQVVFHAQMAQEAGSFDFGDVVQSICDKMVRRHPHVFADATIETAEAQTENWESIKEQERVAKARTSLSPHPNPLPQAGEGTPRPLQDFPSPVYGRGQDLPASNTSAANPGEGKLERPKMLRTLDDVPSALPALMRAQKLQRRAARVGFDWPDTQGVIAKIKEELAEVEEAIASGDVAHTEEEIGDLLFAVTNLARFVKADAETALRNTNAKFTRRFAYIEDALAAAGKNIADASLDEMEALWNEAKAMELG